MASLLGVLAKKSADNSADYGAFHVKCGSHIVFNNERRTAHVKEYYYGFVFSSKPIPAGGMFQVKVRERLRGTFTRIVSDLMAGKLYASKCSQTMDTYINEIDSMYSSLTHVHS